MNTIIATFIYKVTVENVQDLLDKPKYIPM
jgi:hypothetical protein